LKPIVAVSRLNNVLIDGGSGLNILFTKTLKKKKLDITDMLTKSASPFYDIVPGNTAIPLGSVVWLVTFGDSRENYRTEYVSSRLWTLIPPTMPYSADHPSPRSWWCLTTPTWYSKCRVLLEYTFQGDLKIYFECDTEAVELAAINQVPNAMMEIFAASKKLAPTELEIPEKTDTANKPQPTEEVQVKSIDLRTGDSSKTTMIGAGLDLK
jgi:hypothetical protein